MILAHPHSFAPTFADSHQVSELILERSVYTACTKPNILIPSVWIAFNVNLLALVFGGFGLISAVEESTAEELNSDDSKDELEEDIHDEDVGDILQ